ncbi:MAG: biopolymer transporter ExbD, partial [Planctomycetota bacterium]
VFLLLIFFICTSSFEAAEQTLPADLLLSAGSPIEAPIQPPAELEQLVIRGARVLDASRWSVNDTPCPTTADLRAMLAALAAIDRSLPVVLDADGGVPLGDVIDVYDLSRAAGFTAIRFAATAE